MQTDEVQLQPETVPQTLDDNVDADIEDNINTYETQPEPKNEETQLSKTADERMRNIQSLLQSSGEPEQEQQKPKRKIIKSN